MDEKKTVIEEDEIDSSFSYSDEIGKIKRSDQPPEKKLEALDFLIKDFLRKRFHIRRNADYSELINFFLNKRKPHIATFCHEMVEELYGGNELDEVRMQAVTDDAMSMVLKEVNPKEVKDESASIKNLINPFSSPKKIPIPKNDPSYMGKQAKRAMDKYLKLEDEEKPMNENGPEVQSKEIEEKEELDSLKTKLNLSIRNNGEEVGLLDVDDPEKIQNIDDMDRIKEKIRIKKAEGFNK